MSLLLSACNDVIEKKESDPITLIDDLDTSVSYKQLTAVEKDNLTWRIDE